MKFLTPYVMMFCLLLANVAGNAQEVDISKGSLSILKGEKTINIEFNFDKLGVGDYSKEADYIKHKKEEANKKEEGSGDKWEQQWISDRTERYEPKFIDLFTKGTGLTYDSTAKYTLIFKTTFIEPGYQVGVSKKNAQVEGQAWIVETAKKDKKLVILSVERAGESMFRGAAFDVASRIAEAYALVAKKMAKFVKKGMDAKAED